MVGSVWHRWDLHIHTPASYEHQFRLTESVSEDKYQDSIWERYIAALEAQNSVPVIGVTDYFSIEGYKKVMEYKRRGRLANYDLILPNIEFRLDTIFTREGQKAESINFHVIFSDQLAPEVIEREFLECLRIRTPQGEPRSLSRASIEEIGRQLKEQQKSFGNRSDYVIGCTNVKVSFDQIQEILTQKKELFSGKYLTVLALEGHRRTDWEGQAHLEWKRLFSKSDAVFSGHPKTRDYLLGRSSNTPEEFLKSFGKFKPCLHGSDAHSFENLFKPSLDRFMWVKGELTFAGLRQVLYEPDSRVKISPSLPDTDRSGYTLTEIQFQNPGIANNVTLSDKPIPLNHGLVAVIGGKGSGKTALLDLVAHCFEDRCQRGRKELRDSSSFVQRIESEQPTLETSIRFLKDEQWSKSLNSAEIFERSRITYLPQGKIDDYSADAQKLHRKITELVFSTETVAESGLVTTYNELSLSIQKMQAEITEMLGSVESYEVETTDEQRTELSRALALKQGEFDDLVRLRDRHLIDDAHKHRVEELGEIINALDARNNQLNDIGEDVERVKKDLPNIAEMNGWVVGLSSRLQKTGWETPLPIVDYSKLDSALLDARLHLSGLSKEIFRNVDAHREELASLSQDQQKHGELLEQIEQKRANIKSSEGALRKFDEKRDEIKAIKDRCNSLHQEWLGKMHEQRDTYQLIIDLFSEQKDEIMQSVEFKAQVSFDKDDFVEVAQGLFHRRSVTDEDIFVMASALERFGQTPHDSQLAEEYFSSVTNFSEKLKPKRTQADLYRLMHRSTFHVETNVLFDGKPMKSLSMGQKGTVLLTIFLAEGEHLLILDQPEENLDNRFVYEVLVGAIRAAKQRRQILMATHNANLVVNTDAEQVIVANYDDGVIGYTSGALENREIRREVTTLLEGGEEAFRRREQRYNS